ncbi:hypothetical protein [Streptosporangium sp. NBC_01756]|uniref:hypothetical protein n=1 Tax=Streptosporangium sp. NBC_01756 TaxID=2975950 RepID=UPI003FA3916E
MLSHRQAIALADVNGLTAAGSFSSLVRALKKAGRRSRCSPGHEPARPLTYAEDYGQTAPRTDSATEVRA